MTEVSHGFLWWLWATAFFSLGYLVASLLGGDREDESSEMGDEGERLGRLHAEGPRESSGT